MNIKLIIFWALLMFTTGSFAARTTKIKDDNYAIVIDSEGFKFHFVGIDGTVLAPPHAVTGMSINDEPVVHALPHEQKDTFVVTTARGVKAEVSITLLDGMATFTVIPREKDAQTIRLHLGGMPVAHGLGDAGGHSGNFNLIEKKTRTFMLSNNGGGYRWASSFVIFPHNQLAGVTFGSASISVTLGPDEYSMLVKRPGTSTFHYFLGEPTAIYQNYLDLKTRAGYPNIKPKFTFFELGWESWAALGWKANAKTIQSAIEKLQADGFPIRWAVTGSGFWDKGGTSTSFGQFGQSFPDPDGFRTWCRNHNVKWLIGLRTNFVPSGEVREATSKKRDHNLDTIAYYGNPLSDEGIGNGYFVSDGKGRLQTFTSEIFPQVPCYLVDGCNPDAARWYAELYRKWGVDGIKEDTMMECNFGIFNGPISAIAKGGGLVMGRCGSFSAPGTLLRINDTHGAGPMGDRTPINYLQYAASGAPNVYSDTIGFRNDENEMNIRHGWLMSCTAGLAMGPFTWKDPMLIHAFKRMVKFHYEIAPTMYDAAMKSYQTGYPYTMSPLDIAYPGDTMASRTSAFEWLIGESILAAPLVKNYASGKLDVYLPEGIWFDYDTGKKYQGPTTLKDFPMPLDKTPCFVGGKGIIVTRTSDDAPLTANIYPNVKDNTVFTFNHPDGESQSVITIGQRKDRPGVRDTTDEREIPVVLSNESGAVSFNILPGHHYRFGKSPD